MGPTPNSCWVCRSERVTPWKPRSVERELQPDDFRISDARYGSTLALLHCQDCGLLFADGGELDKLEQLYSELDDPGYEESLPAREAQMRWLMDVALRANPGAKTAVDIGAGAGLLVREAQRRGLQAVGVEPSKALVRSARAQGADVLQGTFPHPELAGRKFDIVFLVDVIEHVRDPVGLMKAGREALAPGGVVLLVTPDRKSLAARLLGKRWWHFRLAHVSYFDRKTLTLASEKAGLSPRSFQRARWFLPVGYLAERTSSYLPVAGLTERIGRTRPGKNLFARTIPLDLRDSWVLVAGTR